jgi:Protein of unknown function (DUF3995)
MVVIATIVSVIFILLGILHIYWASGGTKGISKAIPIVDGKPAITPGKLIIILVAIGLMGIAGISGALGYMNLEVYLYGDYIIYSGWLLALILLIRAVGGFRLVEFFKKYKNSEFSVYDSKYYSPFCLSMSIAFLFLTTCR